MISDIYTSKVQILMDFIGCRKHYNILNDKITIIFIFKMYKLFTNGNFLKLTTCLEEGN